MIIFVSQKNMKKVLLPLFILGIASTYAQNKSSADTLKIQQLDQVIVISNTNYQVQKTYLNPKIYYNSVQLQQTSPGQYSPYLGGFTGNQVDQSINGIRVNNGLFRTGPNQYFGWVPMNFTTKIETSDGGNVGGTISRELGIQKSSVSLDYNTGNNAFTQSAFFKNKKFGIGVNNINTGNIKTPEGITEHTAYNQKAVMGQLYWKPGVTTTAVFTRSDTLERTDRWNGGLRESGTQAPKPYTWDLQQYLLLNHKMQIKDLMVNLAYQNFAEDVNDNNKPVQSRLGSYTVNAEYAFSETLTLYSSNVVESINYITGSSSVTGDLYSTFKQGFRASKNVKGLSIYYSLGWKRVQIEDASSFDGVETSLILGYKGCFANFTRSLNAPSFLMIKQAITTGKAVQIPNSNLTQEESNTIRVGYKKKGAYVDVAYRHLDNAFTNIFINADTIQTVNIGSASIFSSTFGYTTKNLFNTKTLLDLKLEYIYGINSEDQPINKTVPVTGYIKLNHKGIVLEGQYQSKDDLLSKDDLNDVRIFAHNKGLRLLNLGYENTYKKINYSVLLYNILNTPGRIYASSADVPMRSLQVNIKYTL